MSSPLQPPVGSGCNSWKLPRWTRLGEAGYRLNSAGVPGGKNKAEQWVGSSIPGSQRHLGIRRDEWRGGSDTSPSPCNTLAGAAKLTGNEKGRPARMRPHKREKTPGRQEERRQRERMLLGWGEMSPKDHSTPEVNLSTVP